MIEAIRKFGLANSDFPTILSNISFFLRVISLNIDPRNQKQIPYIYTVLDLLFAASYCYVYLISMIWFVFWRCSETGDVLAALIIFSLGVASEIGPFKIIFMFIQKKKLHHLVQQCLASNELSQPDSRFVKNLNKALRNVKKRAMVFWSIIISNGVLYILKPIVLPGRHLMEDSFIIYGFEPIFETPNYQIVFILSAMGVCISVFLPSNATAFQIVITGYVEAQMLAWSEELTHLWEDAKKHYAKNEILPGNYSRCSTNNLAIRKHVIINKFVKKRLKVIIKAHASNLGLLKEIENAFQIAVAVEFTLLIVCLIAELLGGLKNTYMEVPFALIQVGMDCLIGQKLLDASVVYEKALYCCNWENFNQDNMKTVMIMLMTAQKSMTLTAGGITKLNYISFIAIIKMIYSTYTTLSVAIG